MLAPEGRTYGYTHKRTNERKTGSLTQARQKMNMVVIRLIYTLVYNVHTVITKKKKKKGHTDLLKYMSFTLQF